MGALMLALVSSACGSHNSDEPRPLTRTEADVLSQMLYTNYESQGARFEVAARSFNGDGTVVLSGVVDWRDHSGLATVRGLGAGQDTVTAVAWTQNAIAEQRPGWAARLAGQDPNSFFIRGVEKETNQLDQLVAVVTALATTQPENAQLILQNEGARFVRTDVLRGRAVNVMRYSDSLGYWVDAATGSMLRMEAVDSSGNWPTVVDILSTGPQTFSLPPTVPWPTE